MNLSLLFWWLTLVPHLAAFRLCKSPNETDCLFISTTKSVWSDQTKQCGFLGSPAVLLHRYDLDELAMEPEIVKKKPGYTVWMNIPSVAEYKSSHFLPYLPWSTGWKMQREKLKELGLCVAVRRQNMVSTPEQLDHCHGWIIETRVCSSTLPRFCLRTGVHNLMMGAPANPKDKAKPPPKKSKFTMHWAALMAIAVFDLLLIPAVFLFIIIILKTRAASADRPSGARRWRK